MGPQHPSTHGVLRLILELDGETVTETRAGIGYLHTGIEKNMEFRNWTQGVTFCTRMDYLTPMMQRGGLLPRRREAARHHRPDPRAGLHHPRPHDGADPDQLPPRRPRHRRHGDGRDDGDDRRVPRARAGAAGHRDDHRPADEQRLHPARRRRPGPAARRLQRHPRHGAPGPPRPEGARGAAQREPDPQGAHRRRRLPRPHRLHGARDHRAGAAVGRAAARPAQGAALLRLRELRLRRPHPRHL